MNIEPPVVELRCSKCRKVCRISEDGIKTLDDFKQWVRRADPRLDPDEVARRAFRCVRCAGVAMA